MSLTDLKKQDLFDYYSENGFQNSTEQIVQKMHICHKTFFNRYGTKSHSIEIAWQFWQQLCRRKWEQMMLHCNHSIEILIMTLYSMGRSRCEEPHFFKYTRDSRKFLEKDSFFYSTLYSILEKGKQSFHINEMLNNEIYITFLLNNLFFMEAEHYQYPDMLRYVLTPALTERGMDLFNEMPVS